MATKPFLDLDKVTSLAVPGAGWITVAGPIRRELVPIGQREVLMLCFTDEEGHPTMVPADAVYGYRGELGARHVPDYQSPEGLLEQVVGRTRASIGGEFFSGRPQ